MLGGFFKKLGLEDSGADTRGGAQQKLPVRQRRLSLKLVVLGASGVGKSRLIRRVLCDGDQTSRPRARHTISVDVLPYTMQPLLMRTPEQHELLTLDIDVWDVSHAELHGDMHGLVFEAADGVILACKDDDRDSMQAVDEWLAVTAGVVQSALPPPALPMMLLAVHSEAEIRVGSDVSPTSRAPPPPGKTGTGSGPLLPPSLRPSPGDLLAPVTSFFFNNPVKRRYKTPTKPSNNSSKSPTTAAADISNNTSNISSNNTARSSTPVTPVPPFTPSRRYTDSPHSSVGRAQENSHRLTASVLDTYCRAAGIAQWYIVDPQLSVLSPATPGQATAPRVAFDAFITRVLSLRHVTLVEGGGPDAKEAKEPQAAIVADFQNYLSLFKLPSFPSRYDIVGGPPRPPPETLTSLRTREGGMVSFPTPPAFPAGLTQVPSLSTLEQEPIWPPLDPANPANPADPADTADPADLADTAEPAVTATEPDSVCTRCGDSRGGGSQSLLTVLDSVIGAWYGRVDRHLRNAAGHAGRHSIGAGAGGLHTHTPETIPADVAYLLRDCDQERRSLLALLTLLPLSADPSALHTCACVLPCPRAFPAHLREWVRGAEMRDSAGGVDGAGNGCSCAEGGETFYTCSCVACGGAQGKEHRHRLGPPGETLVAWRETAELLRALTATL